MIEVREVRLPDDVPAIEAIDTGFETDTVLDIAITARALTLMERRLQAPIRKVFPLDDLADPARPWSEAWIAEDEGACIGFAAVGYEVWNLRLTLWHLYVDPAARRRGVARALLAEVEMAAARFGARHIWLETSHLNAPGVRAYEALGFRLTGLDATLYDGTPAEGEVALFFSKACRPPSQRL